MPAINNRFIALPLFALLLLVVTGKTASAESGKLSYTRDVRPILSDKCFACHGPDAESRAADLRLDELASATADLGGYHAIVPGKADESELVARIVHDDPAMRMPPADLHKPLTPSEIEILKQWVSEGAAYEQHWAYRPLRRPEVPKVDSEKPLAPIDAFIRSRLAEQGLKPSPQADKHTLVRRLYLDLLGVPPSTLEVEQFLSDESPDAWEKLVDKLLADKRFGERMAVYWLDLVRYADTIGYHSDTYMEVSAYRDYVIDSLNDNKPFDQFTLEQLAGDLLPNPSREQLIASGYNRLLQTTEEGGSQPKEYMAIYAADRVRNVSGVWLGSTMGCAQCHDHKYDPFTMHDFYSMAAFFADIEERPVGKRRPNYTLPTEGEIAEIKAIDKQLAELVPDAILKRDPSVRQQLDNFRTDWEGQHRLTGQRQEVVWQLPEFVGAKATSGVKLKRLDDGSLLSTGNNAAQTNYTVEVKAKGTVASIRLEVMTDPSFEVKNGLSRGNGNIVLNEFEISVDGKRIAIADASADYDQPGYPVRNAIDKNANTGWAFDGHLSRGRSPHFAHFILKKPIDCGNGKKLTFALRHETHHQHSVGRFRIGVSDAPAPAAPIRESAWAEVAQALSIPASERSGAQQEVIEKHCVKFFPALLEASQRSKQLQARRIRIEQGYQTTLISKSLATPRVTRILPRGNWMDESGEIVEPAVPRFLGSEPSDSRRQTRLDLAQWIVDDTNPLTPRTFANRAWKLCFGEGFSRNLDDLGGQGDFPSHPELLDWLAVEFRESGWNIKAFVRMVVTSETYQQSSIASPEQKSKDPGNLYLARQGRWRLEAEFIRDSALQLGRLLRDEKIGGKSVKPYQPKGYWQHLNFPRRTWKQAAGDDLYRRSLYTFWCRSFLHPSMLAFDAPSREECTAKRARSNIPQQALVLLNDPIFIEASRAFAERIVKESGDRKSKIAWACREAFGREATDEEVELLATLHESQRQRYQAAPDEARKLLGVGESPVAGEADRAELAAWTQVARAVLNAYETTSRF